MRSSQKPPFEKRVQHPLRLLVINPIWPYPGHSSRAANVVLFELLSAFGKLSGVTTAFLKINETPNISLTPDEEIGLAEMKKNGIEILPPFQLESFRHPLKKLKQVLFPSLSDFYTQLDGKKEFSKYVMAHRPDVIFVPWSEWASALCADLPVPKFAYYGNPDHKSAFARASFRFGRSLLRAPRFFAEWLRAKHLERLHVSSMMEYEWLGDVAANDAAYYTAKGHPNAFYIQNVWISRFGDQWREERELLEQKKPAIIVGSIGKLDGTANTLGLEILGRDLMPELRRVLIPGSYEVHIFGVNKLHPRVEQYFRGPDIHMRGFVPDIDRELLSAQIFLCMNNASEYKVGHTRYLHAWSLGNCVVAHEDASLSMPEIVHGKNALLGRTPGEIAHFIKQALEDENLRRRIGEGGYETFRKHFTAPTVVSCIMEKLQAVL